MKISELIQKLESIKKQHGDLRCMCNENGFAFEVSPTVEYLRTYTGRVWLGIDKDTRGEKIIKL